MSKLRYRLNLRRVSRFLFLGITAVGVVGVVLHKVLLRGVDHAKEPIHGLERDALGLGNEEPDEEEHGEAEAAEDEVGSGWRGRLLAFCQLETV